MRKFTKALVVALAVLGGGVASTQVAHAHGPYGYGGHDHDHGSYGHNHGGYGHYHGNGGFGGYHNHSAGSVHWNGGGVHFGNNGVMIHTGGYGRPGINIGFGNGGFLFGIH